jgi:beta-lactamase class A
MTLMPVAARWTGIADIIASAEKTGAVIGVAAISAGGERFSYNGDRRFVAASTVKIAIMIELFRQIDAGRESLGVSHILRPGDKANGSGIIAHLHEGIAFTLGDLVYLMMSISDNSATNILIDRLGIDKINATMRDLGMKGSTLGRKMHGGHLGADEQENWAVPNDYAAVVAALLEDRAASPASCSQMLALMEKQQNDRRIARYLRKADRPRWGSKTGSLPGVVNDVGFVMTSGGPLILAVFCGSLADAHAGEQLIGDITKAALADGV